MEILVALAFAAAVLFGVDRLLLWLEDRGHVNWRRKGRRGRGPGPDTEIDSLLGRRR